MKRAAAVILALAVLSGAAAAASAAEDPKPAEQPKPSLVDTAKEAKAKRKSSKTKVIRNADVKKSKGKLIVLSTPAAKPVAKAATAMEPDAKYRARVEAKDRLLVAEKKVQDLEKTVQDLEQQYYETNDPNYRDQVIRSRFTQAKGQLDEARQQLADARDALKKLDEPNK